jgi:hypothetical protein
VVGDATSTASHRQRRLAGTDIPVAHPRIKLAQVMADGGVHCKGAGHAAVAMLRQPLRARLASATSRSCRAFLIASERAGPSGNFRAASRASSACASKSEASVCSAFILLRRREQRTFGPLGAGRFDPANRRRNSFHRVARATLEHAVLESSDAGVYTLQIHALPTRRAGRTFSRQQLRQSACAHGCTPPMPKCESKTVPASVRLPTGIAISESQFRTRVEPRMSVMWSGTDSQLVHRNFSV